jgi:hypothetical protein
VRARSTRAKSYLVPSGNRGKTGTPRVTYGSWASVSRGHWSGKVVVIRVTPLGTR